MRSVARKRSRAVVPVDDEPVTAKDLKAIREADEDFARGEYATLDDLKADVARRRTKSRAKKVHAKRSA